MSSLSVLLIQAVNQRIDLMAHILWAHEPSNELECDSSEL